MGRFASAIVDREFANFQSEAARRRRQALVTLLAFASAALPASLAQSQESLCAEVKIEINQKVSLERQAFDAVMRINNGLDLSALTNISVNLKFTNSAGAAVVATTDPNNTSASFFLRLDSLAGKTLRINDDGSIPQDNPFVNTPHARPEPRYRHRP